MKLGSHAPPHPLKYPQNPSVSDFYYNLNPEFSCPVRNRLNTYELVNGVICALDRKVKITTLYFKRAVI